MTPRITSARVAAVIGRPAGLGSSARTTVGTNAEMSAEKPKAAVAARFGRFAGVSKVMVWVERLRAGITHLQRRDGIAGFSDAILVFGVPGYSLASACFRRSCRTLTSGSTTTRSGWNAQRIVTVF